MKIMVIKVTPLKKNRFLLIDNLGGGLDKEGRWNQEGKGALILARIKTNPYSSKCLGFGTIHVLRQERTGWVGSKNGSVC